MCKRMFPYALTGSIFARERMAIVTAKRVLLNVVGNFCINDKPTGAMIGQQPFGGSRTSGTIDKAGALLNLLRCVSPRTIKETFALQLTIATRSCNPNNRQKRDRINS